MGWAGSFRRFGVRVGSELFWIAGLSPFRGRFGAGRGWRVDRAQAEDFPDHAGLFRAGKRGCGSLALFVEELEAAGGEEQGEELFEPGVVARLGGVPGLFAQELGQGAIEQGPEIARAPGAGFGRGPDVVRGEGGPTRLVVVR